MNLPTDYHETLERNREAIERIDEILSEEYCFRCARPAAKCACGIFRNCSPFPPISRAGLIDVPKPLPKVVADGQNDMGVAAQAPREIPTGPTISTTTTTKNL